MSQYTEKLKRFVEKNCPKKVNLGIKLNCSQCQQFFPEVFMACRDLKLGGDR